MKHYTYRIWYTDGKSYVGVRSCKAEIKNDAAYVGSSKFTPNTKVLYKEILGVFATRALAVAHEVELHKLWDVAKSERFYNKSRQTTTKFDTSGVRFERTEEHNTKIKKALTGRKRSKRECAAISQAKRGVSHAPHSAETKRKMSEARKGFPGFLKGQKNKPEDHLRRYASRTKYSAKYVWVNSNAGMREVATCMEMGLKYGAGAKPTQRFRDIVKPNCKAKSYKGWRLSNGDVSSETS